MRLQYLFRNKMLTFICILLTLILLISVFALIMLNIQNSRFKLYAEQLKEQIAEGEIDVERYRQDLEYKESVDFIIEALKDMGMIHESETAWLNGNG